MTVYLATIRFEATDDRNAEGIAQLAVTRIAPRVPKGAEVVSVEARGVFPASSLTVTTNPSDYLPPAVMEELRQMMREEAAAAAVRDHERAFMPHIRSQGRIP